VAEQANQAAAAIAELADAQADGAADTDARVADASRAVTEIVAGLRLVSDNADMAAATARKAQEQAEQGAQAVAKVVDGMDDLRVGVGATAKKIKALGDRSMEIAGMVGSIAKISERTSLLALNAAIEAARAGEHGRGFAVVADNVKDLSEKTQNTTQDIDKLARSIQVETNDSVGAMEEQTATVEDEAKVVAVAGQALDGIRQSATHSAEVVADITQIVKTQAQGAETVLGIMTNLSGLASNNRLDAEKTRQSAQELEHLAGELTSNLSRFKVV
jgi:methyl-accepting chemotaxis protein